jgi:hypothetical protein
VLDKLELGEESAGQDAIPVEDIEKGLYGLEHGKDWINHA